MKLVAYLFTSMFLSIGCLISEGMMPMPQTFDQTDPHVIVTEKGALRFIRDGVALARTEIGLHAPGWVPASQEHATVDHDSDAEDGSRRELSGSIDIPTSDGKTLEFASRFMKSVPNDLRISYRIHFPQSVRLNSYHVSLVLDAERFADRQVRLTGEQQQNIVLPKKLSTQQIARAVVQEVHVAPGQVEGFLFRLDQPAPLLIQDNRQFGGSDIELRFQLHSGRAEAEIPAGETVERDVQLTWDEPCFVVLDENMEHQNDTADWFPFVLPWDDAPFDLSHLNERPAGKHGFVTVLKDQFVFEDGTPIRFWGTCFSARANFPTHQQSAIIARRLAKFGINMVRTHHADAGWSIPNLFRFRRDDPKDNTLTFDPESLDRFDYLLYCLKQQGIYVYLDQLVHREFRPGDNVDAVDQLENAAKPYSNFDERLIELQKLFSHTLWNHVNPYTGLAYKHEPSIALMEFANENDLFTQQVRLEPYRTRLEHRYRLWAQRRAIDVGTEPVDFTKPAGPIIQFFHHVQQGYYEEMANYLRSIDVRVPMTGSNWSRNLALLSSLQVTDYTDSHSYWDHPRQGRFNNKPMVGERSNVFSSLSFNRSVGKPFFVSEWDQPWPNEWRAEHPLAMAAVAAFQGWNGLTTYTYRHSTTVPVEKLSGAFETFNDPARFGLFYHAALIFRRGDVRTAEQTVALLHTDADILRAPNPAPWGIEALRLTPETHQLVMALGKTPSGVDRILSADERLHDAGTTSVRSDTGELYRDLRNRYGLIDTPRTKVAYGFLGNQEQMEMDGLKLRVGTRFATIALSALDEYPISSSSRLLLTAVGRAENTGFRYNMLHQRMLDQGDAPILVEPIEATIELETQQPDVSVWAIGVDGQKLHTMAVERTEGTVRFHIGQSAKTIYYLIEAQR